MGIEILKTLELKLPYITQVNDPLECLPYFYCPDDKNAMKEQWLRTFKRNGISPPSDWEQRLNELFQKGEIQKMLKDGVRESLRDVNRKSCLLSFSKTSQNVVMWAHYADNHSGIVIGIDFNNIYPHASGESELTMHPVEYSQNRPQINVLQDFDDNELFKVLQEAIMTKSDSWKYEKEFRTMVFVDTLERMQKKGIALRKNIKGQNTWFLSLNPRSIREVVFGLHTDESLKLEIKKLIKKPKLQHIKLLQAEESETYTFNLK